MTLRSLGVATLFTCAVLPSCSSTATHTVERVGDDAAADSPVDAASNDGNGLDGSGGSDAAGDGAADASDAAACEAPPAVKLPVAGTLAWTGSGWGLAYTELRSGFAEVFLRTLDATGAPSNSPTQVSAEPSGSDASIPVTKTVHGLVWAAGRYGLLWSRDQAGVSNQLFYTALSAAGGFETEVKIADYAGSGLGLARLEWTGAEITHPAIASGNGYGVAWRADIGGNAEIFFARISGAGDKLGNDVRITTAPAPSLRPEIAWNGNGFGMAWEDLRFGASNHELFFAQVDASSVVQGAELRVTDDPAIATGQKLVWTGSEYGLLWADPRAGNGEVYLARIDPAGPTLIEQPDRITNTFATSAPIGLFWVGGAYKVAWSEAPTSGAAEAWLGTVCP
jgi:hypothetical protein